MDNESNNKDLEDTKTDQVNFVATDQNNENDNSELDTSNKVSTAKKKSSGGLSLLISVAALLAVAYLYYQQWQAGSDNNGSLSTEVIQQLQDSDQVLSTDIQNVEVDVNQIKQQTDQIKAIEKQFKVLSTQVADLNNNSNSQSGTSAYDNSANEASLAQLQQQLSQQAQLINKLQSTPPSSQNRPPNTAQEVLSDNYDQIEKNAAIQVLLTTDVLLTTNRLPQAIIALDNYLKVSGLPPLDKNKILRLLNELKQVDQPDIASIEQQLETLKSSVEDLTITTENQTDDELKWYERFVSVKKIDSNQSISSTTELVSIQSELNRWLYQAKLYLMLKDQPGWQKTLFKASNWVQRKMPENQALSDGLLNLSKQTVVASIPDDLNISKVIDELKGLR